MIISNLQENRFIFNQIRHIQAIGNKVIIINPTQYYMVDVVNIPLRYECCDSILNYNKMATPTKFSAQSLCSLLPTNKKVLRLRISLK